MTRGDSGLSGRGARSLGRSPKSRRPGFARAGSVTRWLSGVRVLQHLRGCGVCSYFAQVHALSSGSTDRRSFGTDERLTIFQNKTGATFTASPPTPRRRRSITRYSYRLCAFEHTQTAFSALRSPLALRPMRARDRLPRRTFF